ncbi:FAD:protein FMN transferase [Alkaliphilus pronyensis]|nr:FAD:protein FMN transferase [Alkaliphilus pronyensis]
MTKGVAKTIILILIALVLLTACGEKELLPFQKDEYVLGGIRGRIMIFETTEDKAEKSFRKAYDRVGKIEALMSTTVVGSDVYNINKNAGKAPVEVSTETIKVIDIGREYESITDGAFNIVLGSLIELWGIGKEWQKVPIMEEIQEAKNHIDINSLEVTDATVYIKDANMLMDLGGIAKGYAVDEAAKTLLDNGVKHGFIELGGDIYVIGNKANGEPWYVGIQNPFIGENNAVARIPIANQSIVSSGDYERYFIEDGVRYHHIIDPETGYPTVNQLVSVTIVSDSCIEGDILSTAVFVMGLEKGLDFVESLENVEAALITKDRDVYVTSGMKDIIEIRDNSFTIKD